MNLDRLAAFLTVMETGSYRRAAERLGVSQPALTRQIQVLEAELGATLLRRGRAPMTLTEAGRHVLTQGGRLVADAVLLRQQASQLAGGRDSAIRIGVLQSLLEGVFAPAVVAWRTAWPGIGLRVMGFRSSQIMAAVAEGQQQLGIVAARAEMPGLHARRLLEDRFMAFLPPQHPLAQQGAVTWDALGRLGLILPPRGFGLRDVVDAACAAERVAPRVTAELEGIGAIIALVQAGMGASLLPRSAALGRGVVTLRPIKGAAPSRRLAAIWRSGTTPDPAMLALIEAIGLELRAASG